MKNLKSKSGLMVLLVALSLTIAAQPYEQGNRANNQNSKTQKGQNFQKNQKHNRMDRLTSFLELTEAQTSKIESLKLEHQKRMIPLKNELNEKQAHMKTLSTAEKADMKAINSLIDEMSNVRTTIDKDRAALHQEIRNELTDEQRIKFDLHANNKEGRGVKGKHTKEKQWN